MKNCILTIEIISLRVQFRTKSKKRHISFNKEPVIKWILFKSRESTNQKDTTMVDRKTTSHDTNYILITVDKRIIKIS